jgi:hypothetical protein
LQSIGIQPEKLALAQKSVFQAKKVAKEITDERSALMNRLWLDRGTDAYSDALKAKADFNIRYPEEAVSDKNLADSFEEREKLKARANAVGARIPEKLVPRISPMLRYGME